MLAEQAEREDATEQRLASSFYPEYRDNPVGFVEDVLGIQLVSKQQEALESLLHPPYCTLCPSGNEQGKTVDGACAVLWWYSTRRPAIVLTTASTARQVHDVLWKEIHKRARQAKRPLNLPFFPRSDRIERAPDDFAVGFTAGDATSAQGQHGENILLLMEEATGIDPEIWEAFETQFSPPGHAWLCLYNPTNTGSRVYADQMAAERRRSWNVVRMSALDHPNINAELRGEPAPVPHAMRLAKFERLLRKWSNLVGCNVGDERLQLATDVVWPPVWAKAYCAKTKQVPKVYRPGPLAEARLLGWFPRAGENSVWSEGDWIAATREGLPLLPIPLQIPEIGCDIARFGSDYTATHVRCGPKSLHHEEVNGQDTVATTQRLIELADQYAKWYCECLAAIPSSSERLKYRPITGKEIPIKVDDTGGRGLSYRSAKRSRLHGRADPQQHAGPGSRQLSKQTVGIVVLVGRTRSRERTRPFRYCN